MSTYTLPAAALALTMLAAPAFASNGGDRTPAGGAFMSTYSSSPYASRAQQGPASRDGSFVTMPGDVGITGSVPQQRYDRRR